MGTTWTKTCAPATEDALEYLPCTVPLGFEKGDLVYGGGKKCSGLYVVLQGRVKVWRAAPDGAATVLGIYGNEQIFGETSLIGGCAEEYATALEKAQLMSWPVEMIEEQIAKSPRLGVALMQSLVQRGLKLKERLRDIASEKTPARVALALLTMAEESGTQAEDGALCFPSLTHQCISEVVGTSREIVTAEMGRLRRLALVNYSRKGIRVYPEALRDYIQTSARLPQPPRARRSEKTQTEWTPPRTQSVPPATA